MTKPVTTIVAVRDRPFDVSIETARLREGLSGIGALVTFLGICRDEGGRLAAIELEHYPEMAEAELRRIVDEAARRWPLQAMAIIHRIGRISVGEDIVLAIAASEHRSAAFSATEFVMDFLKTEAPFWKKEHPLDGSVSGTWVVAKATDQDAARRWR